MTDARPQLIIISAMSADRIIGQGEGMPWNVPEEYRQYLGFVSGNTVIMGRRSYQIFGRDLDRSQNLVISRSSLSLKNARVFPSLETAVAAAYRLGKPVFCAGGASIYRQALPLADALYLSYIKGRFQGDAYFPEIDPDHWQIEKQVDHPRFEFVVYRRR